MKFNWLSRLVPLAVLAVGLSAFGASQSAGPAGGQVSASQSAHHAKHPILVALEQLNLAPKQKSQITGMLKQRHADNKAFRKANQGNLPAIKAHNKQETQAFMTSLKGVLTQSQFQKFETNLRALKGRGNRNAKIGSGGVNPPAQP